MDFGDWITAEAHARGWSLNELARRAGKGSSTVSMVATGRNRPGLDFCVSIAHAFGLQPDDVLRRAGLLPSLPAPVAEEREILSIIRGLSASARNTVLGMLRGLARRAPAVAESPAAYHADPVIQQIAAEIEHVPDEWRREVLNTARMFARMAGGPPPRPRIIGEEENGQQRQPQHESDEPGS